MAGVVLTASVAFFSWSAYAGGDPERGKYLLDAAGCIGCHTDVKNKGTKLSGGRRFETPFGVFYSPNITPDKDHGIGSWSDADFLTAMRYGKSPAGEHYFPVFPYTSYTFMSDGDILDLKAHLFSLAPDPKTNRTHETPPVFGWRFMVGFWKLLNFREGPLAYVVPKGKPWNRGAYMIEALGHCRECHTPRNALGGYENGMHLAGTKRGPEGELVPNITPDKKTGIGGWLDGDLKAALTTGMLPDGDFVGGGMAEYVTHSSSRWTKGDMEAAILYLETVPPVRNQVKEKKKAEKNSDNSWD